ncbi:hypothetical protein [Niallia endozanthoxylica]|uniref:Uncharacterized protein n=1 Tax=Niallia endozanthoxylica TaxID=2036016 RepID=A0A5J5H884_9BACI|nr:hypothetical protein [Niallia endozanthoxylica]KAA9016935.1 hypothetical protein F4V44_20920 [Niallia endozanthoxylica]
MSLIILMGMIGMLLVLFFKRPLIDRVGKDNKLVYKLRDAKWFQNHWLSGIFLFGLNGVFFFLTVTFLYMLMYLFIPFIHLIVMFIAVIASIYVWILINKAWEGTRNNRLKMAAVGSSFYILLTFIFVFWLVNLKPSYPGEDTFMGAIGLVFAIIVTLSAFVTCFVITGFSKGKVI